MDEKYRLVTRSDFDGLVCAALLRQLDLIDDILFVHPKDMQDGQVEITDRDIITNLPYVEGAYLVFDHHQSETFRNAEWRENHVIDPSAPSAARVVWDHYGGSQVFPDSFDEMMAAVDEADSAQYRLGDILAPSGWALLNFVMDPRTGLGRFREFRISNYQLMMALIDACKDKSIDEILEMPDVQERVKLYFEQEISFKEQLKRCATVYGRVLVVDLREEETIYAGNRFTCYALFPETQASIHVLWDKSGENNVLAVGKSILNRGLKADLGTILLGYGGGGHENAGTCQVPQADVKRVLGELVEKLNA